MTKIEELLNTIQNLKSARDLIVDSYNDKIEELSLKLEGMMTTQKLSTLKTDTATAFWQKHTKVDVKDWNAVMQYVAKNNAFDVLQKRISPAQMKARIDAGAVIDGVTITEGKTFIIKGDKE